MTIRTEIQALGVLRLVCAASLTLALAGCGGDSGQTSDLPSSSGAAGTSPFASAKGGRAASDVEDAGTPAVGGAAPMASAGGAMGGYAAGGYGGASGMGAPAPAAPAGPKDKSKPPRRRVDPFAPWWDVNPRPPVLAMLAPARLAPFQAGIQPPTVKVEIQEPPTLRAAGIMTGTGVYALLEGAALPEGQRVVKPGDAIGSYRVESIRPSSVVLRRTLANTIFTMVVPLNDAPMGGMGGYGATTPGYGAGTPAYTPPAMPGGARPGMLPGAGRGGAPPGSNPSLE